MWIHILILQNGALAVSNSRKILKGGLSEVGWRQNASGWWWEESDGSYPKNSWKQINGEWFRFDNSGYCLINRWFFDEKDWFISINVGQWSQAGCSSTIDGISSNQMAAWLKAGLNIVKHGISWKKKMVICYLNNSLSLEMAGTI